jgi:hypothetical protein
MIVLSENNRSNGRDSYPGYLECETGTLTPQQRRPIAERSSFLLHTEEVPYMAVSFKVSLLSSDLLDHSGIVY